MVYKAFDETLSYLGKQTNIKPEIGLILGSGLGALADEIKDGVTVPYRDIPHFPVSTVEGHAGQLVIGELQGQQVVAMQGRFHNYEGYSLKEVTYPVRIMQRMGIKTLVITNAAGGVNTDFKPGDLMLIKDHINLMGDNPLIGSNLDEFGPRFPDMSEVYDRGLLKLADEIAKSQGFKVQKGVYAGLRGPSYETPAEIRFLRAIGADAVGMSSIPEAIVGVHGGQRVLGVSCITNMAAGVLDVKLSHDEVMETAERVKNRFMALIKEVLARL